MRSIILALGLILAEEELNGVPGQFDDARVIPIQSDWDRYPNRYRAQPYGSELRRVPGYGVIEERLYRGESTHPKGHQSPPWQRWISRDYDRMPRREYPNRGNPY